jgi:uncharacterized Tic20 family protein
MRNSVDRSIRYSAMLCHLAILAEQPLILCLIIFLPQFQRINQDPNLLFGCLFFWPLAGAIGSTILAGIIWRATRHRHQFIAASGQEAMNFLLSIVLYLAAIDAITVLGSYGFAYIDAPAPIGFFYVFGALLNFLIVIATLSIVVWASIQVAQGRMYSYPYIIRFLRPI